jgi:hypothetical protein
MSHRPKPKKRPRLKSRLSKMLWRDAHHAVGEEERKRRVSGARLSFFPLFMSIKERKNENARVLQSPHVLNLLYSLHPIVRSMLCLKLQLSW